MLRNYIICAPAGTGKTVVAGLIISDHLQKRQNSGKKVAFVVPTRSLAEQQARKLRSLIPGANVDLKIGDDARLTIKDVLPDNDVIVCTAGKLESEIKDELVTFNDLGLLVLDECHHTHKKDPHANVMEKYFQHKMENGAAGLQPRLNYGLYPKRFRLNRFKCKRAKSITKAVYANHIRHVV